MTHPSDEELGRHLDRRTTSAPLAGSEREELVSSIGQLTAKAPQVRRGFDLFARRLLPAAAAMVAVVVVAVLVLQLPRADTVPGNSPAPSPPAALRVFTTDELAAIARDPTAAGRVVLADTWINEQVASKSACGEDGDASKPCTIGALADTQPSIRVIARFRSRAPYREYDLPSVEPGVLGFKVLPDGLEYLGPVLSDGASELWTMGGIRAADDISSDPHALLPVAGWLVGGAAHSCPAVADPVEHEYGCGAEAWLTPTSYQPSLVAHDGDSTTIETKAPTDGMRVQNGAYHAFAAQPQFGEHGTTEPRRGVYLTRRVGCPTGIPKFSCPVLELVARLDPLDTRSPTASPSLPVDPSPSAPSTTAQPDRFARAELLALADPRFFDYLARHEHDEPVAADFFPPGTDVPGIVVSVRFASPTDDYPFGSCDIYRPDDRASGVAWLIDSAGDEIRAVGPIWPGGINCFGAEIPGYEDRTPWPTPAAPSPVTELQWSVEPFLPESDAQPAAITEVGGRLIVTGSDQDGPAAWYSDDDGVTWEGALIIDDGDGRPRALGSVVGNDDLLLSMGWVYLGGGNDANRRSVLWASTDGGATWERIPGDEVPPRIHDLVAGGPGFVATGNANPSNLGRPDHGGPPHAAIWLSADGRLWERLPDEESFQVSRIEEIANLDGHLVAVGSHGDNADVRPAVWNSFDGRAWSRTQLSDSFGAVHAIAEGPDGLVAVGLSSASAGEWRATAWLSPDGTTWTSQILDDTAGTAATDVAVNGTGFVAVGDSTQTTNIYGSAWFVPLGGAASRQTFRAYVYDIAGAEDRFVGVGAGCGPTADCPASHLLVIGRPGIEP